MAKPALVSLDDPQTTEPTLSLVPEKLPELKLPELKLPKIDLGALFAVQKANLAAAQEAQTVLVDAAQAGVKTQCAYLEQVVAQAKAAFAAKTPPTPEALAAGAKAALEQAVAVTKDVLGLGVAAHRRVAELLTERTQASVAELKALAA